MLPASDVRSPTLCIDAPRMTLVPPAATAQTDHRRFSRPTIATSLHRCPPPASARHPSLPLHDRGRREAGHPRGGQHRGERPEHYRGCRLGQLTKEARRGPPGVAVGTLRWQDPRRTELAPFGTATLLSAPTILHDPLASALRRKAATGGSGVTAGRTVASGAGWRVVDVVCTSGPGRPPVRGAAHLFASLSLVLSGSFVYRSARGASFMSPGALMLGDAGQTFECSHEHGEGDRCLSFQLEPELFERLAHDAGASRVAFAARSPAPAPRAGRAHGAHAADARPARGARGGRARARRRRDPDGESRAAGADVGRSHPGRIARVLRDLESRFVEPRGPRSPISLAGRPQPLPLPPHVQGGDRGHAAPVAPARAPARGRAAARDEPRAGDGDRARRRLRRPLELHPDVPRRVRRLAAALSRPAGER